MPDFKRIGQILILFAGSLLYGCSSTPEPVETRLGTKHVSMDVLLSHCNCCAKHYRMSDKGSEIMMKYTKKEYLFDRISSWEDVEKFYESADANKDEILSLEEVVDFYEKNK
ncbi:MAG: hypothetical protein QW666_03790 [Candidatus Woesearchaeota archaeon]